MSIAKTISYEEEDGPAPSITVPSTNKDISTSTVKSSVVRSPNNNSTNSKKRRKVEDDAIGEDDEVDTDDQYDERVESKQVSVRRKSKVVSDEKDSRQIINVKHQEESAISSKDLKKAYYPMIELQPKHFETTAASKEEKESAILTRVVNEVCALERQELQQYFNTKYPDKLPLLHALENILEGLPKYLDLQMSEDVCFQSEYTSLEKTELFELRTIVETQKRLYASLLKYEEDPKLFLSDHGLPTAKDDVKDTEKNADVSSYFFRIITSLM